MDCECARQYHDSLMTGCRMILNLADFADFSTGGEQHELYLVIFISNSIDNFLMFFCNLISDRILLTPVSLVIKKLEFFLHSMFCYGVRYRKQLFCSQKGRFLRLFFVISLLNSLQKALEDCFKQAQSKSAMIVSPEDEKSIYFGQGQMRCLHNGNFDPLQVESLIP